MQKILLIYLPWLLFYHMLYMIKTTVKCGWCLKARSKPSSISYHENEDLVRRFQRPRFLMNLEFKCRIIRLSLYSEVSPVHGLNKTALWFWVFYSRDLIVAATQNVIPDTEEALIDLKAQLKMYGVTGGDFRRFRMYPKRASDPDDRLENIYRYPRFNHIWHMQRKSEVKKLCEYMHRPL